MRFSRLIPAILLSCALFATSSASWSGRAHAAELSLAIGSVGKDISELRKQIVDFEKETGNTVKLVIMPASTTDQFGQYRLWLAARNPDVDIYFTDVIWAPQLATNLVDLTEAMAREAKQHLPSVIQSQTVDGKLVAFPMYTDAPALYYRSDLLEKYGKEVPKTWSELTATAKDIQDKERAAGNSRLSGFVFQGAPYEGLTCDGLEWIASNGGGQIVSPQGDITINNDKAIAALELAKGWVGTIAPEGVLGYKEEDARGIWQTGNAVFMRNWPYAYGLSKGEDSLVAGKFDVAPLPRGDDGESAACLGGWNLAVSKFSAHQKESIDLVKFLTGADAQKSRALSTSKLPTIPSLYDDPDIAKESPIVPEWKEVVTKAVPRPSAPTRGQYNEVSKDFWTAVNETLSGRGTAADNLDRLEKLLKRLKRDGWR